MGPLIDLDAVKAMKSAIKAALSEGAKILAGGKNVEGQDEKSFYVQPVLMEAKADMQIV